MASAFRRTSLIASILVAAISSPVCAGDNILSAIPADAIGFAVVHNLTEANRSLADVAKLVHAPAPDLLALAKAMSGVEKAVDEQGDLAVVLVAIEPSPKVVVLVPVTDFNDFVAGLGAKQTDSGPAQANLAGRPLVIGHKGSFAVVAHMNDGEALNQFLAASKNLGADTALSNWLNDNKVGLTITSVGLKKLVPMLVARIKATQTRILQQPIPNAQQAASAFNLYVDFLTAAAPEVDQFALGLRVNPDQTVGLVEQVKFTHGGKWSQWSAGAKSGAADVLAGLPAGPFVAAGGGVIPPGAIEGLTKFQVSALQNNNPSFKLTPEQAQRYAEIMSGPMHGLRSMRLLFGVAEPAAGLYSNVTIALGVDDARKHIEAYEKSLASLREFASEAKIPALANSTANHINIDGVDAIEATTDVKLISELSPQNGPNFEKMMHLWIGPSDQAKMCIAPADEHTVLLTYGSPEHLKAALDFYKSHDPGLSADAGIAKTAAALPKNAQMAAYVDPSGVLSIAKQFVSTMAGPNPAVIPEIAAAPPLGIAGVLSPSTAEGYLVIPADTLRAIGDAIAKARH
jgi:hypothetical protein